LTANGERNAALPASSQPETDGATETRNDRKEKLKELFYSWICGVSSHAVEDERNEEDLARARQLEEEAASLEQDPCVKIILYILLIIILSVGVFLYCFFSLWNYTVT